MRVKDRIENAGEELVAWIAGLSPPSPGCSYKSGTMQLKLSSACYSLSASGDKPLPKRLASAEAGLVSPP